MRTRTWMIWAAALSGAAVAAALAAAPIKQQATIMGPPVQSSQFGTVIAADGDTVIAGAARDDVGAAVGQGAAYAYARSGTTWSLEAKLVAADGAATSNVAASVAVSRGVAVIGSPNADGKGAAYVFARSGSTWTQTAKLVAADAAAGDNFGSAVAISDGRILVGAVQADVDGKINVGAAYVFAGSGGSWTQEAKLVGADAAAGDFMGYRASLSGDTALVGTIQGLRPTGSAYVFRRTDGVWAQEAKLVPSDGASYFQFAIDAAVSGDTALIGDRYHGSQAGAAYVYVRTGTTWSQQAILTRNGGQEQFGYSVDLAGDVALIGAPAGAGGVVYVRNNGVWTETATLAAADATASDYAGSGVALAGGTAVTGGEGRDTPGLTNVGALFIFTGLPVTRPEQYVVPAKVTAKINATTPAKSKFSANGTLNTAFVDPDFAAPLRVSIGGLDLDIPGMTAVGGGKSFTYSGGGVVLKIVPGKKGSSKATFSLTRTGDLTGAVAAEGSLKLRFVGAGGLDAQTEVTLSKGKFTAGKGPGASSDNPFQLTSLKATLKGAGLDALALAANFASDGTAPGTAPDFALTVGDLDVTIPSTSFNLKAGKWTFTGNVSGVSSVVLDYAKGTLTVRAAKTTLGTFAEGPVDLTVSLALDSDSSDLKVQAVRVKTSLSY